MKSVIGFFVFIGVSFGVTYAVNSITAAQTQEQQVAAAAAKMLKPLEK